MHAGQFASLAATPPSPGWSLSLTPYYYNGSANRDKTLQIGETVTAGVTSEVTLLLLQPGYAAQDKILSGQPYVGLGWGPGNNRTSVDVTLSQPAIDRTRSDSITGGTDLYPFASLAWASGNNNWMTYVTGDIPVGAYAGGKAAYVFDPDGVEIELIAEVL